MKKLHTYSLVLIVILSSLALSINKLPAQRKASYVKPYVTRTGKIVSGHYRKSYSTSPNVFKNRAKSRYYYHTKGKYTRRRK
ncbi:MAG: hypothetical protein RI943_358 [Bacteroidota bacterium]